jgi:hypothetical protein
MSLLTDPLVGSLRWADMEASTKAVKDLELRSTFLKEYGYKAFDTDDIEDLY